MRKFWLLLFLLAIPCLKGQDTTQTVLLSAGAPSNPCTARRLDIDTTNNVLYFCSGGTWFLSTNGGGSGTVTNIATTAPITGGPITTTGTIACATCATTTSGGALTLDQVGNPAAAWTFDEGATPNVGIITSNNNSTVNILTLKNTNAGAATQGCLQYVNSAAATSFVCQRGGSNTTLPNELDISSSTGIRFLTSGTFIQAAAIDGSQNFMVGSANGFVVAPTGQISKYNAVSTSNLGYGVPSTPGGVLSASLTANVATATLYAVPAGVGGIYRITGTEALVTPAGTSSTLPNVTITCTNRVSSGVMVFSPTMTFSAGGASGNTTASGAFFQTFCDAKASTNIQYATTGYASNAANAMAYSLYILVESM